MRTNRSTAADMIGLVHKYANPTRSIGEQCFDSKICIKKIILRVFFVCFSGCIQQHKLIQRDFHLLNGINFKTKIVSLNALLAYATQQNESCNQNSETVQQR